MEPEHAPVDAHAAAADHAAAAPLPSFNLLGFNVLEAVKEGSIGAVKTTLTISPNYGAIAALFPKPGPFFDIESGRVTVGVSGPSSVSLAVTV